jgi:putative spermidine/putrescine transport system permease protein
MEMNLIKENFLNATISKLLEKSIFFICIAVLIFLILPVLIIIPMSFSESEYLEFPPQSFSLTWYAKYFESQEWLSATLASFEVATMTMMLATVLGTLAAYGIYKSNFRGKEFLNAFLITPMFMPIIIIAICLYSIFSQWHLSGNVFGFLLAHTVIAFPFVFINVSAALKGLNPFYEMASANVGASNTKTFFYITLPLIKNGIIVGALFAFIMSFDEAVIALFLSGIHFTTLPKKMFDGIQFGINPIISAVSTMLNDLEFSSDMLVSGEVKDARNLVFDFIEDQIGLFETAKSLSEEIIQNFFSTKNTAEIIKFCTKYKLPEYYQKSLQGVDPQQVDDFISSLLKRLQREESILSVARDLGIKYLFCKSDEGEKGEKSKRISWEDVGEYLSESELANLIGCSVKTLRNNRSLQKGIDYCTIEGTIRYPREKVKNYLKQNTVRLNYR